MRQGNASITQKLESKPQTQHLVDCPTFQLVYSTEINSEGKRFRIRDLRLLNYFVCAKFKTDGRCVNMKLPSEGLEKHYP